jgi:hypothetical protein
MTEADFTKAKAEGLFEFVPETHPLVSTRSGGSTRSTVRAADASRCASTFLTPCASCRASTRAGKTVP